MNTRRHSAPLPTGSEGRALVTKKIQTEYVNGRSIRQIASEHGRSYGFVHRILSESGVEFRKRGGANRVKSQ